LAQTFNTSMTFFTSSTNSVKAINMQLITQTFVILYSTLYYKRHPRVNSPVNMTKCTCTYLPSENTLTSNSSGANDLTSLYLQTV